MKGQTGKWLAVLAIATVCAGVMASPAIDSAVIKPRIWNDAPYSTFTEGNLYPTSLWMKDEGLDQTGWANRHNFRLSANGGISEAVFMNDDAFSFFTDVTITGTANIEAGINVSPWWSKDVDGVFMLKTDTGVEEVACWGGRLPYYSFTVNHGITYVKGTTVRLGVVYEPNGLSEADPATIQYFYDNGTLYTSPVLAFDKGNELEDPPYGLWGMLNDARVGGFFMPKVNPTPGNWGMVEFENMVYTPEPASLALVALAGLLLRRR